MNAALFALVLLAAEAPASSGTAPAAAAAEEKGEAVSSMSVLARTEPETVKLGERFTLVIEVKRPKGARVSLPSVLPEKPLAAQAGDPERTLAPDPEDPTRVVESIRIPFVALDLEEVETPALVLTTPDGEPLEVPSLKVAVVDDAPATADGKEPDPELLRERSHFLYEVADPRPWAVGGASLFSLLVYGAVSWLSRRRRFFLVKPVEVVTPAPPEDPADVIALARLDALLAAGLLGRGEVSPFVERLMDEVLRDYLERRYRLAAGKETTRELCEELLSVDAPGVDVAGLRQILEAADLVKFARAGVAAESAHEMAMKVRALVEKTRAPREEGAV